MNPAPHSFVRAILLDIEGTTSSVSFVFDVMFPFVRRELDRYLAAHWQSSGMQHVRDLIARDAGHESFAAWAKTRGVSLDDPAATQRLVRDEVLRLMDADAKATGLKQLQGMIWEEGFASGELRAHLFADVIPAVEAWRAKGVDVRIYSSGSIQAQKLFFGHTEQGSLLHLFGGHYDTTSGPKREAGSYTRIAADMRLPPGQILFLSDIVPELDAAKAAGMKTGLVARPGNATPPAAHGHPTIKSFAEIKISPDSAVC